MNYTKHAPPLKPKVKREKKGKEKKIKEKKGKEKKGKEKKRKERKRKSKFHRITCRKSDAVNPPNSPRTPSVCTTCLAIPITPRRCLLDFVDNSP